MDENGHVNGVYMWCPLRKSFGHRSNDSISSEMMIDELIKRMTAKAPSGDFNADVWSFYVSWDSMGGRTVRAVKK